MSTQLFISHTLYVKDIGYIFYTRISVRNHGHGEFLRAILRQSDADCPIVQVSGFTTVNQPSFFFDGRKWHYIAAGGTAVGTIKTADCGYPAIENMK